MFVLMVMKGRISHQVLVIFKSLKIKKEPKILTSYYVLQVIQMTMLQQVIQ